MQSLTWGGGTQSNVEPSFTASECGVEFRENREQVADQPDVGNLENRRVGILVDGHDRAGILDAGQVLDGAGNTDGYVKVRGDDLACLPDLQLVGHVAGVHRRTR